MNTSIAICLLLSLVMYHTRSSRINEATFMYSTSNLCLAVGTDNWGTNGLSHISCSSLCTEEDSCKGVIFNKLLGMCQICTSYGVPGQQPYFPEATLFRKTNGEQCNMLLLDDVPDSYLTASSEYGFGLGPSRARLSSRGSAQYAGAWSSADWDTYPYIQARFNFTKEVTGIETKGRNNNALQCVSSYKVSYSLDCVSFADVTDANNAIKVFPGNSDSDTSVINDLPHSVLALCVRIHPLTWIGYRSLRFDVHGCDW